MYLKNSILSCGIFFLICTPWLAMQAQDAATLKKTSQDFIGVAHAAIPAVVSIQVKSKTGANSSSGFFEYDPPFDVFQEDFFGRFFGIPKKDKGAGQIQISQASGFLVSPDGYIVTNDHVVKDSGAITVKLNDGREFPGKIIGEDESTDVALIKIEGKDLPFLKLGDSDALQVGQWVSAIGNPLGLQASLTVGVVSAKGRSNLDLARIEDFIQTDAAINRGNSGGPLLNLNAEVIGMNTAIATNYGNGGYMGIGFAIPSNMIKHVKDQLIKNGTVTRGYLGVILQEIDNDLAQAFELKKVEGALVAEVLKDSPAEQAHLKQGDIILKVNGQTVDSIGSLRNFIALQQPGDKVTLNILRNKQPQDIAVVIGSLKDQEENSSSKIESNSLGLKVQTLTPELAKSLNIPEEQGVIVVRVDPASAAAFAGIKKGAVILEVNKQKVSTQEAYEKLVQASSSNLPLLLLIRQGDMMRYVSIRVEK